MAMTLRLTDEQTAALRALAAAEQRSMQDVSVVVADTPASEKPSSGMTS